MEPDYITRAKRPPSVAFKTFAEPLGPIVTDYDSWDQLLLYRALITARGRAHSFKDHKNARNEVFAIADCHYWSAHECDAQAGRRGGQFCIAVSDALPYQMLDIFSLAFAAPSFFPEIGDPHLEDQSRVAAREKPAGYGFFRKSIDDPIRVKTDLSHPNCPIREQAALYFTGMALDAIWSHELSHAFMGHVDYADTHLGLRALNETPHTGSDLRQMPLEAEADRFSAGTIVQGGFGPVPYLPNKLHHLPQMTRIKAGFVVSAVITWFWAFQQRIDRTFDGEDPYHKGSHPPPLARLHLSFDGARDVLLKLKWSPQQAQNMTFDAMAELEHLAEAKDWFSILHPERSFSKEANAFVRDVKQIIGSAYVQQASELDPLRYTIAPDR